MKNPNSTDWSKIKDREQLRDAVHGLGWSFIEEGNTFKPSNDMAFVMGVVLWSQVDSDALALLEQLPNSTEIAIFHIDDYTPETISTVATNLKAPLQTPVLLDYLEGDIVNQTEGKDVVGLIDVRLKLQAFPNLKIRDLGNFTLVRRKTIDEAFDDFIESVSIFTNEREADTTQDISNELEEFKSMVDKMQENLTAIRDKERHYSDKT